MERVFLPDILIQCQKGTKLYSPLLGEVTLEEVDYDRLYPIVVTVIDENGNTKKHSFSEYGLYYSEDEEVSIFPNDKQRDWNKFKVEMDLLKHRYERC